MYASVNDVRARVDKRKPTENEACQNEKNRLIELYPKKKKEMTGLKIGIEEELGEKH